MKRSLLVAFAALFSPLALPRARRRFRQVNRCEYRASNGSRRLPDAAGNVYVANWYGNSVIAYSPAEPRSCVRSRVESRILTRSRSTTGTFVGNYGRPSGSFTSNVAIYGCERRQPSRTIVQGVRGPYAIAFGHVSNALYVANYGGPSVTVYPGRVDDVEANDLERRALSRSNRLRSSDNLYVANWANNSVTVYAAGKAKRQDKDHTGASSGRIRWRSTPRKTLCRQS